MNTQAIQILFLKDLFLSRWPLFGYLAGGLLSAMVACLPGESAFHRFHPDDHGDHCCRNSLDRCACCWPNRST